MAKNKKYIFVIGPARSGTTMLGRILSKISDSIYIEEPTGVWLPLFYGGGSDEIDLSMYSDKDITRIRRWFQSKLNNSNKTILIEKSPANSLRPDVVRHIFPESYIIYLKRSEDRISASALKQWNFKVRDTNKLNELLVRIKIFFVQIKKLSRLTFLQKLNYLYFKFFCGPNSTWGPRYRGIDNDLLTKTRSEVCAIQAARSLAKIDAFLKTDKGRKHELVYESLLENPAFHISETMRFLEIDFIESEISFLSSLITDAGG